MTFAEAQNRYVPAAVSVQAHGAAPGQRSARQPTTDPKMFAWLASGRNGEGMERVNYPSVVDRDFGDTTNNRRPGF